MLSWVVYEILDNLGPSFSSPEYKYLFCVESKFII